MTDEPNELLRAMFAGHGVDVALEDGWLAAAGPGSLARARFTRQIDKTDSTMRQLEVDVLLPDGRMVNESFLGWASTPDGAGTDAFRNFASSSAHVLLSAFWNTNCADQVDTDVWTIAKEKWRATLGGYVVRSKRDPSTFAPPTLLTDIQTAVCSSKLMQGPNWFRHFYANIGNGQVAVEALMNNEPWAPGEDVLRAVTWPHPDEYWSLRHFLVIQPA